jgi:N-acetylglucosamine kinase
MRTNGRGRSSEAITEASLQALDGVECSELLVAGNAACDLQLPGCKISSLGVGEARAALALAGEHAGVVALAGTGAFVYGRTHDGRHFTIDGLGPLVGDFGGAYHLGHMALRAAAKSGWAHRYRTSLAESVREHLLGDPRSDDLGQRLIPFSLSKYDRADIAGLAEIVDREANAGDAIARELIITAATALAESVRVVIDHLEMAQRNYCLVRTGSLVTHSSLYWETLCGAVSEFAPLIRPIVCDLPPVVGVAIAALEVEDPTSSSLRVDDLLHSVRHSLSYRFAATA